MMKSPKQQASPRLSGVREMFRSPKEVVSPRYTGIREMVKTPKPVQSPRLAGVREMMKTPKEAASPQLKGDLILFYFYCQSTDFEFLLGHFDIYSFGAKDLRQWPSDSKI